MPEVANHHDSVRAAKRLPPQIKFIVGNEACERLSYYGMLSILTLYTKNALQMDGDDARSLVHLFKTAVYFLPLFGGWLADRWLGRYWTILSISLFYCLGHGVLAMFEGTRAGLYTGLALIAVGAGGIKPCVSAFVGDQFGPDQQQLLPKVYGLFYWAINLGAFVAFAFIPVVRDHLSYSWAFGVPGIFMAAATVVFWMGSRHYVRKPPARETKSAGFLTVAWYALRHQAQGRFSREEIQGAKAVLRILTVFAAVPVFWALFDQINSTWVLQGTHMRTFSVFGYLVDAERIQSLSALLVLLWIPVFTIWLYPLVGRLGLNPTPLRRMGTGMVLAAVSFVICGWIQRRMDHGESLSLAWQCIPYAFLEAGEVMLSATGLEFAFSQAPASMKSTIMSFWLITVAVGNFLVASVTWLNKVTVKASGEMEFYFYALLMTVVAGVFALLAMRYRESNPTSGD